MTDFHTQRDPAKNRHFYRRWRPHVPPSPAEIELAKLRLELGNIEATRIFRQRVARGQVRL
jgi:hypothetical protein